MEVSCGAPSWRFELCCIWTSVCECVAISGLDWEKPNSPMMCVDHGVRLGEAQFSSGGVTYSSQLVNMKWVAPMDERCMKMRPGLDWEKPNSRSDVFLSYDLVFVVGSVQGGEGVGSIVLGSQDRGLKGGCCYLILELTEYFRLLIPSSMQTLSGSTQLEDHGTGCKALGNGLEDIANRNGCLTKDQEQAGRSERRVMMGHGTQTTIIFWNVPDSANQTGDSGPRPMEDVNRAHSEESVYPEAWRLSVSPPNFQHAESEPFIGPQRPHSSHADSEGFTSRRNNPWSAEAAAPAPADENRPTDPTLPMDRKEERLRVPNRPDRPMNSQPSVLHLEGEFML
ncbi:hypothetical protein F2Q69_00047854 [Brassica cretica]|uniref:Uncharacterized protein n=1 Tax=Brassica cretica TaxID=69181 RepID=A0A8S9PYD2_BRACR|nr:hypothetical protein F2Q69_00047854 [Brassica cretica]